MTSCGLNGESREGKGEYVYVTYRRRELGFIYLGINGLTGSTCVKNSSCWRFSSCYFI